MNKWVIEQNDCWDFQMIKFYWKLHRQKEWMHETWMNEWMKARNKLNEWTNPEMHWINEWTIQQTGGQTDRWISKD